MTLSGNMKRVTLLLLLNVFCLLSGASAGYGAGQPATEITSKMKSTNIARIGADTLVLITGTTYRYTVDTPEDKGLSSTQLRVENLSSQIESKDGSIQIYKVISANGAIKTSGNFESGDRLLVSSPEEKKTKTYHISVQSMALSGELSLAEDEITMKSDRNVTIFFTAGQRSPDATVRIFLPPGINCNLENTTVNVIGRGDVKLADLHTQSIGRVGTNYSYSKVGEVQILKSEDGGSILLFKHLDLRPANGPDLKIVIDKANLPKAGSYVFKANYTTSKPEVLTSPGVGPETAILRATQTISNLEKVVNRSLQYRDLPETYTTLTLNWNGQNNSSVELMQSLDNGKTWNASIVKPGNFAATLTNLQPDRFYSFRLKVKGGENKGLSNVVRYYSGMLDIKSFGVKGDGKSDDTGKINEAIAYLNEIGGGTLLFSDGVYSVRTVHLKSNVYLYLNKGASILALKGADAPETTWFSDKKYRSGLSPTDSGPYADPENYLTKQDVGHHYFRNTMFFGERLDNVKIIGNGYISGNGNLVTGDRVMNNPPENRADKMFTLKLCTNLEIGGLAREEDLWYDPGKDEPYYIGRDGSKIEDLDNMLKIDRAGHFVLLATGTDNINVHDTYFAKYHTSNARDIYDFMACNNVKVTNIYSKVSSDDIVKPGSDCSLGFTRPASGYMVRNIIGDTNCNLFQIGSETADDITDVHVDNIYVLGANKAGFSISTNDGAHIKDIHLNCGHTGKVHSRSKMFRTTAPFFISISNRARILGANVSRHKFDENGVKHDELLVNNVNIGKVENIILNGVDIAEVYGGSSYSDAKTRWKPYDGKQRKATPIIAGYSLPDPSVVEGGLNFKLPNGNHTGYIKNIVLNDINVLVKGGNPVSDTSQVPPELGVGQYNISNLKVQPSYGLWARHVQDLNISKCTFSHEQADGRYALFFDDVIGARITDVKMLRPANNDAVLGLKNAGDIVVRNTVFFDGKWGNAPSDLSVSKNTVHKGINTFPLRTK